MKNFSIEKLHSILEQKLSKKYESELEALFFEDMSRDFGKISDSFSWRNATFARKLATLLLNHEGKFIEETLLQARELSKKSSYPLVLSRSDDAAFRLHVHSMLEAFLDPLMIKTFYSIRAPLANPVATKMIRHSLFLEDNAPVTEEKTRIAALSALFCKLRQNVGSCFATAFAIRIQEQTPLQFLQDISLLFQQGTMKRVVEGKEYIAPMNGNYGLGELKKPLFFSDISELARLSHSFPLIFSLKKSKVLESEDEKEFLDILLKSRLPHIINKEIITAEKLFEVILLEYYQLDPNEVEKERIKKSGIPFTVEKKEIKEFEKTLQITKAAFVNLTDHALLKSWEFTLASFSEAQSHMAQWTLTTSLGLNPESVSGIGQLLQKMIEARLKEMNVELENLQHQINHAAIQLESLQRRAASAQSEQELLNYQATYRMQQSELNRSLGLRDELHAKGTQLGSYFPQILQFIQRQYKECFQEVYDPEMQEVVVGIFDDMPAGFRLCFKHGRSQPSSWTIIQNLDEFIRMVSEFFVYLEFSSQQEPVFQQIKDELPPLWRGVHQVIRDRFFQKECFIRLAEAFHEPPPRDPLQYPQEVKHKPWAYVSGGQLEGLYSCYYRKSFPQEVTTTIASPKELLLFYLNTMKTVESKKKFLAFSPTHAFLLYPNLVLFSEGWQSKEPQVWVENWTNNALDAIAKIQIETHERDKIKELLLQSFPFEVLKKRLSNISAYRPYDFYKEVSIQLGYENFSSQILEQLQSLFYEYFPLFFSNALREKTENILNQLSIFSKETIDRALEVARQGSEKIGNSQILGAKELLQFVQTTLLGATKQKYLPINTTGSILKVMSQLGYSLFHTILVGNTNWTKEYFGFLVNPVTEEIDFWRTDFFGRTGFPLTAWQTYLHNSTKKWGIILD